MIASSILFLVSSTFSRLLSSVLPAVVLISSAICSKCSLLLFPSSTFFSIISNMSDTFSISPVITSIAWFVLTILADSSCVVAALFSMLSNNSPEVCSIVSELPVSDTEHSLSVEMISRKFLEREFTAFAIFPISSFLTVYFNIFSSSFKFRLLSLSIEAVTFSSGLIPVPITIHEKSTISKNPIPHTMPRTILLAFTCSKISLL